jgi:hypothetical protein
VLEAEISGNERGRAAIDTIDGHTFRVLIDLRRCSGTQLMLSSAA